MTKKKKKKLSHKTSCFRCHIATSNFLVPYTCEIRFHDVIGRSICIPTQKFQNKADLYFTASMFRTLIL